MVSEFDFHPWRLSGVVYGCLMNDPAALAALGDAVHQAPYKAPPKAPVLYLKPRNTLAASGSSVVVPQDANALEIGAALGIVIGRTACRVAAGGALDHVAGWTLVADLSVPHAQFYRPSVRFKALDGSCLIGPRVAPRDGIGDPDALTLDVAVDGVVVQRAHMAGMIRPVAQLLADVTEFMTLRSGDILMLGIRHGAPTVAPGQEFSIAAQGLGRLDGRIIADTQQAAA